MKYNTDRDYWKKWYPADFITESFPGQFRNWFYALLAMSTMMERRPAAVQNAARPRPGARPVRPRRCTRAHGNSIEFDRRRRDEDSVRTDASIAAWLYLPACAHPATNLNFGPDPPNEVRGKFHIKLWNCYAFFCNYARLDGFDPTTPQVPVKERPDIDRWILSDLQGLIKTAREAFERST